MDSWWAPVHINNEEFLEHFDSLVGKADEIIATKGREYSDIDQSENRLANFVIVAELLGITPLQVWAVYVLKHMLALTTIARSGQVLSESFTDRCVDLIVYAALGAAIWDEMSREELPF